MIPLNNYIQNKFQENFNIDGHIHLFSDDWVISPNQLISSRNVGFFDVEPKKLLLYTDIPSLYDKFIETSYRSDDILLAAAVSPKDMIEIHQRHPDIIKGFGEIKAYSYLSINDDPLSELSLYDDLKDYARDNFLPIYIHYSIHNYKEAKIFENWIRDAYKVVLCHYGMEMEDEQFYGNNENTYHIVKDLLNRNANLYSEATWASLDYFYNEPNKLLGQNKVLLGSDLNRAHFTQNVDTELLIKKMNEVKKYINSDKVVKNIFNL